MPGNISRIFHNGTATPVAVSSRRRDARWFGSCGAVFGVGGDVVPVDDAEHVVESRKELFGAGPVVVDARGGTVGAGSGG